VAAVWRRSWKCKSSSPAAWQADTNECLMSVSGLPVAGLVKTYLVCSSSSSRHP
jgi:hypothetical protein